MHVGAADSGERDVDDDFARAGSWPRDLLHGESARGVVDDGLHQCIPMVATLRIWLRMNEFAWTPRSSPSCHRLRQMPSMLLICSWTTADENDSKTIGPS